MKMRCILKNKMQE